MDWNLLKFLIIKYFIKKIITLFTLINTHFTLPQHASWITAMSLCLSDIWNVMYSVGIKMRTMLSQGVSPQQKAVADVLPHPDTSRLLVEFWSPRCIATASVLSFSILPSVTPHMETVWSHFLCRPFSLLQCCGGPSTWLLDPGAAVLSEILSFSGKIQLLTTAPTVPSTPRKRHKLYFLIEFNATRPNH